MQGLKPGYGIIMLIDDHALAVHAPAFPIRCLECYFSIEAQILPFLLPGKTEYAGTVSRMARLV